MSQNDHLKVLNVHDGRFIHTKACVRKHTHGTECVWMNVLREMLSFSWRRLSQHTHVTSLSGHFILLFKLFRTPPLRRLWRFAQQKDSSAAVSLVYSTVGRKTLCVRQNCVSDKRKRTEPHKTAATFYKREICGKDSMLLLSLQERENKYELQFVSLCYVDQTLTEFCTQTRE